jgi:hypothetical protein
VRHGAAAAALGKPLPSGGSSRGSSYRRGQAPTAGYGLWGGPCCASPFASSAPRMLALCKAPCCACGGACAGTGYARLARGKVELAAEKFHAVVLGLARAPAASCWGVSGATGCRWRYCPGSLTARPAPPLPAAELSSPAARGAAAAPAEAAHALSALVVCLSLAWRIAVLPRRGPPANRQTTGCLRLPVNVYVAYTYCCHGAGRCRNDAQWRSPSLHVWARAAPPVHVGPNPAGCRFPSDLCRAANDLTAVVLPAKPSGTLIAGSTANPRLLL